MKEYHKINSVYMRDEKTHKFLAEFAKEEFDSIGNWYAEEKIDGTNIRVHFNPTENKVSFGGRTDSAQIPFGLLERLTTLFPKEKFESFQYPTTLYGEGVGHKIQPGGGLYVEGLDITHDFILFDVTIETQKGVYILGVESVTDVATKFGVRRAPVIGEMTLEEAVNMVKDGFQSRISTKPKQAEGLVLKTKRPLFNANGERIITKVKTVDFK